MDSERPQPQPHRTTSSNSSTSELFVCFTSRLSSSSMKLSSKSILSPSRTREPPQISLSSSLSRRLKSNGSMKGGQASPMFPTGGKRRGCGFENPEPSSPKVTCIGQVRVKTKKQGKKMRARSKRRGEASFRKTTTEQAFQVGGNPDLGGQNSQGFQYQNHQNLQQECLKHRNQRWVHLPLTICEALREFSCFFPCRSSCMSSEREKEEKGGVVEGGGSSGEDGKEGSCGAAFARWLVTLQEGDGKGRGIELVMDENENENENDDGGSGRGKGERSCSQRRHVFEDIDIDLVEGKKDEEVVVGEEEEKARVSICIPPKNALLLMRCRSDPVKMAALANRFWESPVHKHKCEQEQEQGEGEDEDEDEDEDEEEKDSGDEEEVEKQEEEKEKEEEEEDGNEEQHIGVKQDEEQDGRETEVDSICERETETVLVASEVEDQVITFPDEETKQDVESNEFHEAKQEEEKDENVKANENAIDKGETFSCVTHSDLEKPETQEEEVHLQDNEDKNEKVNDQSSELSSSPETFTASEPENDETKAEKEAEAAAMDEPERSAEGSTKEEEEKVTTEREQTEPTHDPNSDPESKERVNGSNKEERERETLPECLLLMMCEPKLSMEVSKETWVCSTDFIRWLPERPAAKTAAAAGGGKRVGVDSSSKPKPKPMAPHPQPLMQPPRSSCSFPAAGGVGGASMAMMIEQKLVGSKSGNGYEPFVLTRCKSEPMRSSAKLAPEACFWNNRKLEPHPPPAQLGVGAPAGVGF